MTEQDLEKDHAIQAVIQNVQRKPLRKLLLVNQSKHIMIESYICRKMLSIYCGDHISGLYYLIFEAISRSLVDKMHLGIARLANLHHVIVVFQNVINQTVAKKNVHHRHVIAAFQSATKKNDARKSANQKNQNVNGQTGRHSAHAVHHAMKVKF